MTKHLNFTVAETSGRTFEISMDKVKEILDEMKKDKYLAEEIENLDLEDDYQLATFFMNFGLDELAKYELDNSRIETVLADSKFTY